MAQRLNKELREEIFNNAIAGAFHTNKFEVRKKLWLAGRAVYVSALGGHAKTIKALPDKMIRESTCDMSFRFPTRRGIKTISFEIDHNFKWGFPSSIWNQSDEMQADFKNIQEEQAEAAKTSDHWPFDSYYRLILKTTPADQTVTETLKKAYLDYEKVLKDYDTLSKTLNGTLNSCYSVEKLLEMWPRAAEYLPMMPVTGQAMAINIPALEKLLDASRS